MPLSGPVEDFITSFHNLQGTTLDERKRNLYGLLQLNKTQTPEFSNELSENLTAYTYLESIYLAETLIFFRCKQQLFELLKEGNEEIVSKIAKQRWFFQDTFNTLSGKELVNEILPNLSYCVRMKVLRQLAKCWDGPKFDDIFNCLVEKYGISKMSCFICYCSPGKIKQVIKDFDFSLHNGQLKVLFGKSRDLIEFYFDCRNIKPSYEYHHFLKFILAKDFNFYMTLQEKYNLTLDLGRRQTKKIIALKKDDIISNPNNYYKHLKRNRLVRYLRRNDLKQLLCKLLAKKESTYDLNNLNFVLRVYPEKGRFLLYKDVIEASYGRKLEKAEFAITSDILYLAPDPERQQLAQIKVDLGYDYYQKFFPPTKAIPLIKEQMNIAKEGKRENLIGCMVESCTIHNDKKALNDILKYFIKRHINDSNIYYGLYQRLAEFGMDKFDEEMWDNLKQIWAAKKFHNSRPDSDVVAYIQFLRRNNKPFDYLIEPWLTPTSFEVPWKALEKEPDLHKYTLLFMIDYIDKIVKEHKDFTYCQLIFYIEDYNKKHKSDQINFLEQPRLVQSLFACLQAKNTDYLLKTYLNKWICSKTPLRNDLLPIFWKFFNFYCEYKTIQWLLKYDPVNICDNFDMFFTTFNGNFRFHPFKVTNALKKYSHLNLPQKMIEKCESQLQQGTLSLFSKIASPDQYVRIAEQYKPKTAKADLRTTEGTALFEFQCDIGANFKNVNSLKVLPSLLNYCIGDYFNSTLTSLLKIVYKTPENQLDTIIWELSKRSVTVKKHALFLTLQLCDLNNCIQILDKFKTESNTSVQKHLLKTTVRFFIKNPSDKGFELLKLFVEFIKKDDEDSLQLIVCETVSKIPLKYRGLFIEVLWSLLQCKVSQHKLQNYIKDLLSSMSDKEVISLCRHDFLLEIIDKNLLKTTEENAIADEKSCNYFVSCYLLYYNESYETKVNVVFRRIHEKFQQNPKGVISLFKLNMLLLQYHKSTDFDLEFMRLLGTNWEPFLNPVEYFSDYVKLFFFKLKFVDNQEKNYERIVEFINHVIETFSAFIFDALAEAVKEGINWLKCNQSGYDYYDAILTTSHSINVCMVLIKIIPARESEENEAKHKKIIETLREIAHPVVKINLNLLLN